MADWQIEPLGRGHVREAFSCGKPQLDEFLRTLVSQYEKRNLGRTYVAVKPGENRVYGYYTLAAGAVSFEKLPTTSARRLPKHPVPVVLLARLAVDTTVQGQGLGGALLVHALRRSLEIAEKMGIHAVEVDAIDEQAKTFYEKYGFVPLLDNTLHLFLPVATIKTVLATR